MGLSQSCLSAAPSGLLIYLVFGGALKVLGQREEARTLLIVQYLGILTREAAPKSLIISSWRAHLPVFQDLEAEIIHFHSELFNPGLVWKHKTGFF